MRRPVRGYHSRTFIPQPVQQAIWPACPMPLQLANSGSYVGYPSSSTDFLYADLDVT